MPKLPPPIDALPSPVITEHEGFLVVRDDMLPGGTKVRALPVLFDGRKEYVYAGPRYGYAQLALAHAARRAGKRATVFVAASREWHPRTLAAIRAGATAIGVPYGYLNVVKKRARDYCIANGAKLLPFGLDDPAFIAALADVARALPVTPREVWTVAGSGVLTRALQAAWPEAAFNAVQIGGTPRDVGWAELYVAPEKYEEPARCPPPFPSCDNYDAKAWQFISQYGTPGSLLWNVGA